MPANAGARVVATINGLSAAVETAADALVGRIKAASDKSLEGFHKIEKGVCEPWEKANTSLDDFVNQLTNNPPADAAPAGAAAPVKVDVGVYRRTGQEDTPTPGRAGE
jgi:hypothetical protein